MALPQVRRAACARKNVPFAVTSGGGVPVGLRDLLDRLRDEPVRRRLDDEVEPAEPRDRGRDELARAGDRRKVAVRRPAATTCQPSASSRAAIARPIRPVPPAISARLLSICKTMLGASKTERGSRDGSASRAS